MYVLINFSPFSFGICARREKKFDILHLALYSFDSLYLPKCNLQCSDLIKTTMSPFPSYIHRTFVIKIDV
jgi:hypothetical protein